ncbi:BolA family transcriptional regulator [Methylocapsa polymorpha]|uniref:BolA family transcriptional regulator n=1 Tax=Methylocapsa polymorpha TaxID=3080828 RepID=A0ABZ0HTI6_9HYPH|nr:BolA family transcriptional regulator [Methylocapsa sp. RX1]
MAMEQADIERLIKEGIPDAKVQVTDLVGDKDHYAAVVISSEFTGKTKLQQHQIVYKALGSNMGGALHALQLTTYAPK